MPTGTAYGARGLGPVIVLACVAAALLAACTSAAGSAAQLPSVPASPSVSVASTPASAAVTSSTPSSASPTPTTAKAAVEAAVRAYYAAVNKAISTGDTADLAKLTDKGCPCEKLIESVNAVFANGGSSPNAQWKLSSVTGIRVTGRVATAKVRYRAAAYTELDASQKVLKRYPAYDQTATVALQSSSGSWLVSNYFVTSGRVVS